MRIRLRILLLGVALLGGWLGPAEAYRRVKIGPFEVVPTFSLELKQHSNVYVVSDKQKREDPSFDVSGLVFYFRPGLNILVKPNLEKRIKGLYFNFKYTPSFIL